MKRATLYLLFIVALLAHISCELTTILPKNVQTFVDTDALIADAKTRIIEIEVTSLKKLMDQEEYFILIDVRTENEHDLSYIPGSVLIPRGVLEFRISNETFWDDEGMYLPEKKDLLIIYCKSGNRSTLAADVLQSLGYKNILSLKGGWKAWKELYPDMLEKNEAPALIIPSDSGSEADDASC